MDIPEMYIKVLDDGFVRLEDVMGKDDDIARAARISYGAGTKQVHENRGLIRYLKRHRHTTPFEMVELKFHIRIPMDAWRQMVRHRTANINEYSTRYSEAIDSNQETRPHEWRAQSATNKQGSGDYLPEEQGRELSRIERELHARARQVYKQRLSHGVAREQARKDLPLSTYTEVYYKMDLHNLFHFLELRLDKHAQLEIRMYAEAIAEIVRELFPIAWESFEDYQLNAVHLSAMEFKILRTYMEGIFMKDMMDEENDFIREQASRMSDREVREFNARWGNILEPKE